MGPTMHLGGAAAPQTSAPLLWEVAATQTSALFYGSPAPPDPNRWGVAAPLPLSPRSPGAHLALSQALMNHNTSTGINPDSIIFFEGIIATFEFLLSIWDHLFDRHEAADAARVQQQQRLRLSLIRVDMKHFMQFA